MEAAPDISRLFEVLISLLSIGLPGLPPGERDPKLWHGVPDDAVIAYEWSGQGSGTIGATGIDGAVADPEVRALFDAFRQLRPHRGDRPQPPSTIYEIPPDDVARVLLSRPGCLYVALAPPESGLPPLQRLRAAVIVNAGDQAEDVIQQLQPLLPEWMLRDTRANPSLSALVTGLVQHRRAGPYLAWGMNVGATDEALARLTSGQPVGLVHMEEFSRRLNAANVERPSSVMWVHPTAVVDAVLQFVPQAAALKSQLPPEIAHGLVLVSGVEQGRVVTRGSCARAEKPVITMSPDLLRFVPADAHVVLCGPLELDGQWLSKLAGLTPDGRDALEQMRSSLVAETTVDLGPEVYAAFGTRWTIYSAPSTGGPFGLGPVLAVQLKQPLLLSTYFPRVMARWSQELEKNPGSGWSLKIATVKNHEVYSLRTPNMAREGLLPSWCLTDTQLLLTFQPQPLRSHLQFLDSPQPRFITRLGPDLAFPDHATAWGFVDSSAFTRAVWPMLPFVIGRTNPDFDTSAIPSTAVILRHSAPTTFSVQARTDYWLCECRNPLSLAAPIVAGAAMAAAIEAPRSTKSEVTPATLGVTLGSPDSTSSGVQPAVAAEEKPAAASARKLAPALIRAFTPQDVQSLIPVEVFRRLEEGPTPEQQQRKKERQEKRAQRKGTAP